MVGADETTELWRPPFGKMLMRGLAQALSVLAIFSDNPSSNPAYKSVKFYSINECLKKRNRGKGWPIKKNC